MIEFIQGDVVEVLRGYPDESFDACLSDPPYGLSREPDALEVLRHWLAGEDYEHRGSGFMGHSWDTFVPGPNVWREVLRVLRPGTHALVFGGTRTYDLTVLAMRIAGFEVRDQLVWLQGQGFPKSTTALKPALEPIVLARKPRRGTVANGLNIDACRIGSEGGTTSRRTEAGNGLILGGALHGPCETTPLDAGRWPSNVLLDEAAAVQLDRQSAHASRFFFCAKASTREREAGCSEAGLLEDRGYHALNLRTTDRRNHHPCVKPIALARYLARLITPPGGTVLVPFSGSGSEVIAADIEGFHAVGIERSAEYVALAQARAEHWRADGLTFGCTG